MREIKFRAWDNENGGMVLWEQLVKRQCFADFMQAKEDDPVVSLMQFTGMKDKTGKEVYEGDIIVCGHDTGKSYNRYVIEFSDSAHAYLARQVGCTSHIGSGYWGNTMLVIGNIHENPELLEVKR